MNRTGNTIGSRPTERHDLQWHDYRAALNERPSQIAFLVCIFFAWIGGTLGGVAGAGFGGGSGGAIFGTVFTRSARRHMCADSGSTKEPQINLDT